MQCPITPKAVGMLNLEARLGEIFRPRARRRERIGFPRRREVAKRAEINRVHILVRRWPIALIGHVEIARDPAWDHAGRTADDRRLRAQPAALLLAVGQALGERTERCAGKLEDLARLERHAADQMNGPFCHEGEDSRCRAGRATAERIEAIAA